MEACSDDVLRKKVVGFYEYLVSTVTAASSMHVVPVTASIVLLQWMRNKGSNGTSLFDELPRSFQAEVSLATFKTMMEKVGS